MKLDWEIEQNPIYNSEKEIIEGYKEIRKITETESSLLSVMKTTYHPLNVGDFKSLVNKISSETDMELSNYQEYKKGKIITAQLKSNTDFEIAGSKIEGYLTLGTGFDGGTSFFIGHTNEFLRCANQFGRILTKNTTRLTRNSKDRIDEVLDQIIIYNTFEEELYESFERMQKVKVDSGIIKECVERVIGLSAEERVDNKLISNQKRVKLISLRDSIISESKELGDNAFALFNGITHYSTHVMKTKEKDVFGNLFTSKGDVNKKGHSYIEDFLLV